MVQLASQQAEQGIGMTTRRHPPAQLLVLGAWPHCVLRARTYCQRCWLWPSFSKVLVMLLCPGCCWSQTSCGWPKHFLSCIHHTSLTVPPCYPWDRERKDEWAQAPHFLPGASTSGFHRQGTVSGLGSDHLEWDQAPSFQCLASSRGLTSQLNFLFQQNMHRHYSHMWQFDQLGCWSAHCHPPWLCLPAQALMARCLLGAVWQVSRSQPCAVNMPGSLWNTGSTVNVGDSLQNGCSQ